MNSRRFFKIVFFAVFALLSSAVYSAPAKMLNSPDASMQALWQGFAHFAPLVTMQITTQKNDGQLVANGMDQGTQIVPIDGVWYLFNREFGYAPRPAECFHVFARIVVRSSTDHGKTWSPETVIAEPDLAQGECGIGDGHAYYDKDTGTWHYLAQMQTTGAKPTWNINHYYLQAISPIAPFTRDTQNPVIRNRDIWDRICANDKACHMRTGEEGTPEISEKKDGFYYVTFHGSFIKGPHYVTSYRGIVKTPDFHTWLTDAPELPKGPIWSGKDCQGWNVQWDAKTGCIGGGHASTLITPNYVYMLIESSDLSSICTAGQTWVAGLVRAKTFVASGHWEQYPNNPLINAHNNYACSIQYPRIFQDNGSIYITYWTHGPTGAHDPATRFHIEQLVQ